MQDDERHRDTIGTERGERVRAALLGLLANGPQDAADLLPQLPNEISLSEVNFQLARMAEEGKVSGQQGGVYHRLI